MSFQKDLHLPSIMKSLIFLSYFQVYTICCPFDNYDDALLPLLKPIQIMEIKNPYYDENQSDSFSLGFWSICIPQQQFLTQPFINKEFDKSIYEDGQLLFTLLGNGKTKILIYLVLDYYSQTIQHFIILFRDDENFDSIIQDFPISDYEGLQIFTLITIQQNLLILETSGQEKQVVSLQIIEENLQIIVGGQAQFNNMFNFSTFRGRLSKIIFQPQTYYDETTFSKYTSKCTIPSFYNGEQIIDFVPGLKFFDGNTIYQTEFLQIGDRYCLQGWMKYDFSKLTKPVEFPVIRISMRKNYDFMEKPGDQQLKILAYIDKQIPFASNIYIIRDSHIMPNYDSLDLNTDVDYITFFEMDDSLYNALNQWHYLYYEYGFKLQDYTSLIQIQFNEELGLQQQYLSRKQFINSIFYIFIGGDDYLKSQLQASISDLKFYFNYENDKDSTKQLCHYSCLTCNGPLINNCLSCDQNSNRFFLIDTKTCECKFDYLDKKSQVCSEFFSNFQSIEYNLIMKQQIKTDKCEFGYFEFSNSQLNLQCIQCPFMQNKHFQCLECLLNPQDWYLNPICRSDLEQILQSQETPYFQNDLSFIDYEVYFIDSVGFLTFYPQYQGFCDPTLMNNCFQAKQLHLGQYPYVYCKQNYYLNKNECIFSHPYCLEVDQYGNCQISLNGMYQKNGEFYECPVNCPSCYFDNQTLKIKCQKCIEKYSLIQDECIQCGQNCKTCQQYTDIITEDTYLKCYQCIDNSKYFLSFDGINCQENTIKDCKYAFLADKNNIQQNTLDYQFKRRFDTENLIMHCARCKEQQIYIFNQGICGYGIIKQCIFGYALEQCSLQVDEAFLLQVQKNNFYDFQGQILQFFYLDDQMMCTTQQFCIEKFDKVDKQVQFSTQCMQYNKDCAICIANQQSQFLEDYIYSCLVCDSGFYSERSSGKCQKCPAELNCYQCFQQSELEQDDQKTNIRAFYFQFIEGYNQHPLIECLWLKQCLK